MGKFPFKTRTVTIVGDTLKLIMENALLELHPELMGCRVEIEMRMDIEKESITLTYGLCDDQPSFLDRPEPGKHLDS